MTKRILIVAIIALSFLLLGLGALYIYNHNTVKKTNNLVSYIPGQAVVIIKVKETSAQLNEIFSANILMTLFELEDIKSTWLTIDSITSRNYKTNEILKSSESYFCIDSMQNLLVLVNLHKKTKEYFIDQFIANNSINKKLESENGLKVFYPQADYPVYYFVDQNVFGISTDESFLTAARNTENGTFHPQIIKWDNSSNSAVSVFSRSGFEEYFINHFVLDTSPFDGWFDGISTYCSFDAKYGMDELSWSGQIALDTAAMTKTFMFSKESQNPEYIIFEHDSLSYINRNYLSFYTDSSNAKQICPLSYTSILDSTGWNRSFLLFKHPNIERTFLGLSNDTSVQIINMADPKLGDVAVIGNERAKSLSRILPFNLEDNDQLFATLMDGYLVIANSTETLIEYIAPFPQNFTKQKVDSKKIISVKGNAPQFESIGIEFEIIRKSIEEAEFTVQFIRN